MKVVKNAASGTLESSDALVTVEPCDNIEISIDSKVALQFGEDIEKSAREMLSSLEVTGARVTIKDQGALNCVLCARLETALKRGAE